jgi:hypothetical protein
VLDQQRRGIEFGPGRAAVGIAEEGRRIGVNRRTPEGGDATVGDAVVPEVLDADGHERLRREAQSHRRIDAPAPEPHAVAVALGVLDQRIEPHRHGLAERLVEVDGRAAIAVRAQRQRAPVQRRPLRLLRGTVDQPAGRATAEDHRVGSLEHLDAVDVVKVAVVLDVIAHAVDVEVARGADAAEDGRLPVALALGEAHARHVSRRLGQALRRLVAHLLLRDDGDGSRRVAQRRVGLGGRWSRALQRSPRCAGP